MQKNILSISLLNESGSLSRVIGLFSQRNYNIENLMVITTKEKKISKINITTQGNKKKIKQIKKQLNKLINVIKVNEIEEEKYICQEILLLNISLKKLKKKEELYEMKKIFKYYILYEDKNKYIIQTTNTTKENENFINEIKKISNINNFSRSGTISIKIKK